MSRTDAVERDAPRGTDHKLAAAKSVLADRERELLELKGPCSTKECRLHRAHSGPCDTRPVERKKLRWGDPVRVACSATGRYLGEFDGKELALFVSAMDNSVCIDLVDRRREPMEGHPVPTGRELEAACNGLRYERRAPAVEIEVRQLTDDNGGEIAQWCGGTLRGGPGGGSKGGSVILLDGEVLDPGDYVMRGVDGQFYRREPGPDGA